MKNKIPSTSWRRKKCVSSIGGFTDGVCFFVVCSNEIMKNHSLQPRVRRMLEQVVARRARPSRRGRAALAQSGRGKPPRLPRPEIAIRAPVPVVCGDTTQMTHPVSKCKRIFLFVWHFIFGHILSDCSLGA